MSSLKPLRGVRVLSLALNLPGPAALMRLVQMGASCTKVNPPSGDPMQHYTPEGYDLLHTGVQHKTLDLKTSAGQTALHKLLPKTDVLLTSFRPSALTKLGLGWKSLHKQYPALSLIEVVGAPGPLAEIPGHDLTYQAEVGLVNGMDLPPSLFADMGGALMASEATLKALITLKTTGKGSRHEVALSDAAAWLALPRQLRMTTPDGAVGGAHAGYRVYAAKMAAWPWLRWSRTLPFVCARPLASRWHTRSRTCSSPPRAKPSKPSWPARPGRNWTSWPRPKTFRC